MRIKRLPNRKKGIWNSVGVMVILSGGALFYVWLQFSLMQLGHGIKRQEVRLTEFEDEKARMQSLVSRMESPASLAARIESAGLGLRPTDASLVIQVGL